MSKPSDVSAILDRRAAHMARLGEGQAALELREVSVVVTNLIEALAAIRDFRGELNAPVANSVKLRGIARAALAYIGSAP